MPRPSAISPTWSRRARSGSNCATEPPDAPSTVTASRTDRETGAVSRGRSNPPDPRRGRTASLSVSGAGAGQDDGSAQAPPYALPFERFDGAVLFWEETGGQASSVWSCLQVLRHSGILDRISGKVVGIPEAIDGLDSRGSPSRAVIRQAG
ncbi:hypothetical protein [Streptomyces hyaluromycini]|uniref:hypothetical protein n=1 Tax=Streptomyces hyaluromycini TaxID=1377993 RepID=UPI0023B89990|nr:hypothetical protein [Streptomyces hyaluromycini]